MFMMQMIFIFHFFLAALGVGCCPQAFLSCGERGLLSLCAPASPCGGWEASLVVDHGINGARTSGAVALSLCCPAACGIFPDQGSNPGLLNWQADSSPLDQG